MLADLLTPPLAHGRNWQPAEIAREVDKNVQGLLGYVGVFEGVDLPSGYTAPLLHRLPARAKAEAST